MIRSQTLGHMVPRVPFTRLDKLGGSIIVGYVEPKAMRDSCWSPFAEAERISMNKVCTFTIGIIQGVEEVGSGRVRRFFMCC